MATSFKMVIKYSQRANNLINYLAGKQKMLTEARTL